MICIVNDPIFYGLIKNIVTLSSSVVRKSCIGMCKNAVLLKGA
jgi:hypothetical protein